MLVGVIGVLLGGGGGGGTEATRRGGSSIFTGSGHMGAFASTRGCTGGMAETFAGTTT